MSHTGQLKLAAGFAMAAAFAVAGTRAIAQSPPKPVNDLPNPYRTVENYFKLPEGGRGDRRARSRSTRTARAPGSLNAAARTPVSTPLRSTRS